MLLRQNIPEDKSINRNVARRGNTSKKETNPVPFKYFIVKF